MYIWTWNPKENPQEKLDLNPALYQEKRKLTCVIIKKWLKKAKTQYLPIPLTLSNISEGVTGRRTKKCKS